MQVESRDAYGWTRLVKKVFLKNVNFDVYFEQIFSETAASFMAFVSGERFVCLSLELD